MYNFLPFFSSPIAFLLVLIFLLSLLAYLAIRLAIPFLERYACFAIPNDSSNHAGKVPHGAGLIMVVMLVSVLLLKKFFSFPFDLGVESKITVGSIYSFLFLTTLLVLSFCGFVDDRIPTAIIYRFAVQSLVALFTIKFLLPSDSYILLGYLPFWLDRLFGFLFILTFMNFFNFMDGSDGMSAVQIIGMSIGFGVIPLICNDFELFVESGFPSLVLLSLGIGFLFCNWHPARVFLGDGGSIPLGFFLSCIILLTSSYGYWEAAVILPLYYYCDAGFTLLYRILRGERFWLPHKKHFYKRALQKGRSHDSVARAVANTNCCLLILTVLSVRSDRLLFEAGSIILALVVVLVLLLWMNATPQGKKAN